AVADADLLGHHGAGGEEQIGRRAMRIFLKEMMLNRPDLIEAQLVGEPHLLEAIIVDRALGLARPRPRHRDLIKQPELHGASSGAARPALAIRLPGDASVAKAARKWRGNFRRSRSSLLSPDGVARKKSRLSAAFRPPALQGG